MVMEKLEKSSHSSGDWSGKPVILRMLQVFGAPGASSSFPPPHNYLPHVACWAASQGSRYRRPARIENVPGAALLQLNGEPSSWGANYWVCPMS